MNNFRLRAAAVVAVTTVTLGCKDIPLLPTWDADWYVPLTSRGVSLSGPFGGFGGTVPAGTSVPFSSAVQQQSLDGAVGGVIDQEVRGAEVIVTLTKTLAISTDDTIFVAASAADLTNAAATRVVVPTSLAAADQRVTDTVAIGQAELTMLRNVASAGGDIYVQLRGQATWAGPGTLTVTSTDSIGMRLALLTRIAVSR
jgi:hypothetical protein